MAICVEVSGETILYTVYHLEDFVTNSKLQCMKWKKIVLLSNISKILSLSYIILYFSFHFVWE
jgi:hypothetical protein